MEKVQPAADPGTGGVDAIWARAAGAIAKKPNAATMRFARDAIERSTLIWPFILVKTSSAERQILPCSASTCNEIINAVLQAAPEAVIFAGCDQEPRQW